VATVPAWAWELARLRPDLRPEAGALDLRATGSWDGGRVDLELSAAALRVVRRELDRLQLTARWANGFLSVPELAAEGIGSELRVSGLELQAEAPYLVALGEATATSDDVALAAKLLGRALPVELPAGQDATLRLAGAVDDRGRLVLEAELGGTGIAARADGVVGA